MASLNVNLPLTEKHCRWAEIELQNFKTSTMENQSSNVQPTSESLPIGNANVMGSIKKRDHYCRLRDCKFHNGIKDECVLCSNENPDVREIDKGIIRCLSYCP